ncbi:MAG: hypothetical protein WCJ02_09105 [bacterium]
MKRFTQYTVALMVAIGVMHPVCAGERELSYAIEDTSFQAVMQLTSDVQGKAKNIAFVKLTYANTPVTVPNWRNLVSVFETSLVKDKPQGISFVTHADKTESWTEIDKVFDAVTDFGDYDPKTLPKTGIFKVCDAFMVGQLIDAREKDGESSVRVALRLIKVETSEIIWAATVEGIYETPRAEPEVTMDMRKALVLAADDAVKALDAKADGYQALLMPFKGEFGKTTRDIFLSALSKADKKVTVLALPDEGDDRRVARFLRNRVENGKGINSSVLQWIVKKSQNGNEATKCAILDGKVVTQVDSFKGKPARWEAVLDVQLKDINHNFAVVSSVSGTGVRKSTVDGQNITWWDKVVLDLQGWLNLPRAALIFGILILLVVGYKLMIRVR